MDERQNFVARYTGLLERFAEVIESIPDDRVDTRVIETGSTPAMIVSHMVGSVSGSVLGIACGKDVYRNREEEFQAAGMTAAELGAKIRELSSDITETLGNAAAPPLDEVVTPPQSLLGLQPPREMARREPVAHALAHAGEHLGELLLIRDLMAKEAGSA